MAYADRVKLGGHSAAGRLSRLMAVAGLLLAGAAQAADPDLAKASSCCRQVRRRRPRRSSSRHSRPTRVRSARISAWAAPTTRWAITRARGSNSRPCCSYDNLPHDLHGQAEIYDQVAADYAAGRRWRPFYYGETGIGNYRENSSSSTDIFGGAGDYDTFLPLRVGGGWNTSIAERHSFNGTLDYRFRRYDESSRRNDSDLRWNFNLSRPVDDDNLRFGMRGRVSYRGDGQYRNDWGVFADYRIGLGATTNSPSVAKSASAGTRAGPLRDRTRDIAELTANWTHSLANGRTSLSLGGSWARNGPRRSASTAMPRSGAPMARSIMLSATRSTASSGGRTSMSPTTTSAPTSRRIPTCCGFATTTCGILAADWCGDSRQAGRCARRSSTTGKTATSTSWPTVRPNSG